MKDKNVSEDFDRDKFSKKCYDIEYTGADIAQIVAYSRNEMYKRCGIFDKMNNKTYSDNDLKELQYSQEDFDKALMKQKTSKKVKQEIGFKL